MLALNDKDVDSFEMVYFNDETFTEDNWDDGITEGMNDAVRLLESLRPLDGKKVNFSNIASLLDGDGAAVLLVKDVTLIDDFIVTLIEGA